MKLSKVSSNVLDLVLDRYESGYNFSEIARASKLSPRQVSRFVRSQMGNRVKHDTARQEMKERFNVIKKERKGNAYEAGKAGRHYKFSKRNYKRAQARKLKLEFERAKNKIRVHESRFLFEAIGS